MPQQSLSIPPWCSDSFNHCYHYTIILKLFINKIFLSFTINVKMQQMFFFLSQYKHTNQCLFIVMVWKFYCLSSEKEREREAQCSAKFNHISRVYMVHHHHNQLLNHNSTLVTPTSKGFDQEITREQRKLQHKKIIF